MTASLSFFWRREKNLAPTGIRTPGRSLVATPNELRRLAR